MADTTVQVCSGLPDK